MIFGLLIVLGIMAIAESVAHQPDSLPRSKLSTPGVSMGHANDSAKVSDAAIKKYIAATMRLDDPEEIAKRARRLNDKYPKTARIIMARARELAQAQEQATKAPMELFKQSGTTKPYAIFSMLWTKFLLTMVQPESEITATNHLGYFLFAWPRLVMLKMATNLRKEDKEGRKMWVADFVEPMTTDEFIGSTKVQYDAFVKSMLDYLPVVLTKFRQHLGTEIDGKKVTLSGLLAIAHRAGIDGMRSWLTNPDDRQKHPNTTATFVKATEVF